MDEKHFKVTVQYVDYPMGVSPIYSHTNYLTKEEAEALAKKLDAKTQKGSVYAVYKVAEMT